MITSTHRKIERLLYLRGFSAPIIRSLMAIQIMIAAVCIAISIATFWFTLYPTSFTIGTLITVVNFWHIARFCMKYVGPEVQSNLSLTYFFIFLLKFFLIGIVLFMAIYFLRIPLFPLLVGLTLTVATIVMWAVLNTHRKPA